MKNDNKNSTSLNSILVRILCTPGMHGGHQCVAQLLLSQAMVFFWLLLSCLAVVLLCMLSICTNLACTRIIPKSTVLLHTL